MIARSPNCFSWNAAKCYLDANDNIILLTTRKDNKIAHFRFSDLFLAVLWNFTREKPFQVQITYGVDLM